MFGDLVINLVARINQFTRPMNQARGVLAGFRAQATSAVSGVMGVFGGLTGIGSIVGGAMAGLTVGSALTWGANLAIEAEKAEIAFGTMLKSPEKAKALLADLSKFAAETPYESPEITDAAKQLLAYGTSADDIVPQLRMLGDVASGVGMPLGELAYLFGTAQVQGKLFTKDINQFTGRGIPIIENLAAVMGVAKGEVMGLASAGQITADVMQQAFQRMTGKGGQFAGMMAAQSQTTSGLWSNLTENLGLALKDTAAAFMGAFDVKDLMTDAIGGIESFRAGLVEWMPTIEAIGGAFRGVLDWAIGAFGRLWRMLQSGWNIMAQIVSAFDSMVGTVLLGDKKEIILRRDSPVGTVNADIEERQPAGPKFDLKPNPTEELEGYRDAFSQTPEQWAKLREKEETEQRSNDLANSATQFQKETQDWLRANEVGKDVLFTDDDWLDQNPDVLKNRERANKVNDDWASAVQKANATARDKRANEQPDRGVSGKAAGAITAGSAEFFQAIFGARGTSPQEKLAQRQLVAQNSTTDEIKQLRREMKNKKLVAVDVR